MLSNQNHFYSRPDVNKLQQIEVITLYDIKLSSRNKQVRNNNVVEEVSDGILELSFCFRGCCLHCFRIHSLNNPLEQTQISSVNSVSVVLWRLIRF